jgi:hypothetical protein
MTKKQIETLIILSEITGNTEYDQDLQIKRNEKIDTFLKMALDLMLIDYKEYEEIRSQHWAAALDSYKKMKAANA